MSMDTGAPSARLPRVTITNTNRRSLHGYLISVQLLALVLVILTLTVYFIYSFRFIERQILQANEVIHTVINDGIDRALQESRILAFYLAYNSDVQSSLFETDVFDLIKHTNTFYSIANMHVATSQLIDDVALFTRDLSIFRNVSSEITYSEYKYALQEHLLANPYQEGELITIDIDKDIVYFCIVLPVYTHVADSRDDSLIGYCLTSFRIDRINELFRRVPTTPNSRIAIIDGSGKVISMASMRADTQARYDEIASYPGRFVTNERRLPGLDVTLMSYIPKRDIYLRQLGFFVLSLLLVGILLSVVFLIVYRFNGAFNVPIENLVGQLESIDGTDRLLRVEGMPENEIGYIATSINSVLDKIHGMTERSVLEQKRMNDLELHIKDAELLALQSQINPHFMYNTLECMRSIGMDYGSSEIVQISTGLADILRYCLSIDFEVPLERELSIVEQYARIIRFRFDERYSFEIDADESVREAVVIKMIIQPIVENAVFHGLEKRRTGTLRVSCRRDGELVVIEVRDNGEGMEGEQLERIRRELAMDGNPSTARVQDRRGIGIINIHRRIETFYGERYGLEIESSPATGTAVTLKLPVLATAIRVGS